jgi:hypothetical protein
MFPLLEESLPSLCSFFGSLSNWKRMSSSIRKNKKKDPMILQQQQQQQPSTGQQRAPFRLSQQILLLLSCKNSFSFIAAAAARVSIWLTRVAGRKKNDQLFEGFLKLRAAMMMMAVKKNRKKQAKKKLKIRDLVFIASSNQLGERK